MRIQIKPEGSYLSTLSFCAALLMVPLLVTPMSARPTSVFTTSHRNILLNGSPFTIRGICYSPTPVGVSGSIYPYGDYWTINYQAVTQRDLANLRRMGVNVVRSYGWLSGPDHTDYLDRCYNGGERPIYVLVNRWIDPYTDWTNATVIAALEAEWRTLAQEVANHPAVMGVIVGNEVNLLNGNGSKPEFWEAMNTLAAAIKSEATSKLVGIAVTWSSSQIEQYDATLTSMDFWGIQVYPGLSYSFRFDMYAARSEKPLILTETGYDAYDNLAEGEYPGNAAYPADVLEGLLGEIRDNAEVCSGVCIFEYSDEWWKAAGDYSVQDPGGYSNGSFPDRYANEEWWGVFRITDNGSDPDILTPRASFYRIASYWRDPVAPTCAIAVEGGGVRIRATCDADLRDMGMRIERSGDGTGWTTLAEGAAILDLASTDPDVTVAVALGAGASGLAIEVHDADPASRGPVSFYRVTVQSR